MIKYHSVSFMVSMMLTLSLWSTLSYSAFASASPDSTPSTVQQTQPAKRSGQILNQELLLNQLITSIHVLQLDFLDHNIREELQEQLILLDANFKVWRETSHPVPDDTESTALLATITTLWPIINQHSQWLSEQPKHARPPKVGSLLRALGKLDRQLMLLRQTYLSKHPSAGQHYRFLEQALMMQRLTRDYLSLTVMNRASGSSPIESPHQPHSLNDSVRHFDQTLNTIQKELNEHPHAGLPLKQSIVTWQYIVHSIQAFPNQPVPLMVVRYGNRIVSKLSSVQRMF